MNKPKFNPDMPFEAAQKPKFDPSASYEPVDSEPDVSMAESAGRALQQGGTLGWADELRGGLSALTGQESELGRLSNLSPAAAAYNVGKTAYDRFSENGFSSGLDKYKEAYNRVVGSERQAESDAEAANPGTYLGGQIAGGVLGSIAAPGLNAAKGAKLGATAGKAALQGGITGAGMSEADNLTDLAIDTGVGAGLGGAAGSAMYGAGKIVDAAKPWLADKFSKAVPKFGRIAADVPEEYTKEYLERGGNISARTENEILDDLTTRYGSAEDALMKAKDEQGLLWNADGSRHPANAIVPSEPLQKEAEHACV